MYSCPCRHHKDTQVEWVIVPLINF
jgi:hypothetical protein